MVRGRPSHRLNRRRFSSFQISVGASGKCYGRLSIGEKTYRLTATVDAPLHVVEEFSRGHESRYMNLSDDQFSSENHIEQTIRNAMETDDD